MQPNQPNPYHLPNTFSNAELQVFESEALSPDDPEVKNRVRKSRPKDRPSPPTEKNNE